MSAERRRKAKNDQIQAVLLSISYERRENCLSKFNESLDQLDKQANEDEIVKLAGNFAIEVHKMVMERIPKAKITVEDCVHFLFDSMKST